MSFHKLNYKKGSELLWYFVQIILTGHLFTKLLLGLIARVKFPLSLSVEKAEWY
jgi:hypothetical protein